MRGPSFFPRKRQLIDEPQLLAAMQYREKSGGDRKTENSSRKCFRPNASSPLRPKPRIP